MADRERGRPGLGAFTRLGFTLWYAIPAGALIVGDPVFGAVLYAANGVIRTGSASLLWLLGRRRGTIDPMLRWLERQHVRSQQVAGVHLAVLSAASLIIVGF